MKIQKIIQNLIFTLLFFFPLNLLAQSIEFQTNVDEIYADMPFRLSIILKDFEETPEPIIEDFSIENAQVTFRNLTPQISHMTSIINGHVTQKKEVTYVFSYNVTASKEGTYTIPPITAKQNQIEVSTQPATFTAKEIETTDNFKVQLELPTRPIWMGESFDAYINIYLNKNVEYLQYNIPILHLTNAFEIEEPLPNNNEQTFRSSFFDDDSAYLIDGKKLPYTLSETTLNGIQYTLYKFRVKLTPIVSGKIDIPASKVMANLQTGTARDRFGYPIPQLKLHKASDIDRTFNVKELPSNTKPPSFSNAIGDNFSIKVSADRTVVKVGDPIVLTVQITSNKPLDGLILPKLNASHALPQAYFSASEDSITAQTYENTKTFTVPVRVKTQSVREIPPIPFSFFNPQTGIYKTVSSTPIALSVTDVEKISADQVYNANPNIPKDTANTKNNTNNNNITTNLQQANINLELSNPKTAFNQKNTPSTFSPLIISIYASPMLALLILLIFRKNRERNSQLSPQKHAIKKCASAIHNAKITNAMQASKNITNALNELCTTLNLNTDDFKEELENIQSIGFHPSLSSKPLPAETTEQLKNKLQSKIPSNLLKFLSAILAFSLSITLLMPQTSIAQNNDNDLDKLNQAHEIYKNALNTQKRDERLAEFQKAQKILCPLAQNYPNSPQLLTDCANAAFSANDLATAIIAYKNALNLDPLNPIALKNSAFIRSTMPDDLIPQSDTQTMDSLFFLNTKLSHYTRALAAAIAFALAFLLFIPWSSSKTTTRLLRFFAFIPFLLWIWLLTSLFIDQKTIDPAVISMESTLRAADSLGAPPIRNNPLPPGTEVLILEKRDNWINIQLPNQQTGWIPASNLQQTLTP